MNPKGFSGADAAGVRSERRTPAGLWRTTLVCVLGVVFSACGGVEQGGEAAGDAVTPFPGSAPTLETLGRSVLGAVQQGDTAALERLRLSEGEHNGVVWPELPAAAPEVNFPVDLAWMNLQLRNRRSLERLRTVLGDRRLIYERTVCRGPVQRFRTFEVWTDCWVRARDAADPAGVLELRLFKDAIRRGGGFKIFRYYEGPLRRATGAELRSATALQSQQDHDRQRSSR